MLKLQDEYQKKMVYQTGYQSFIVLMVVLIAQFFASWLLDYAWQRPQDSMLLPIMLSGYYFLVRVVWKDAYIGVGSQKEMKYYIGLSIGCLLMGGNALYVKRLQPISINFDGLSTELLMIIGYACIFGFGCLLAAKVLYYKYSLEVKTKKEDGI